MVCYGLMISSVSTTCIVGGVSCTLGLMVAIPVANLVLEETIERIYSENVYADKFVGLFLIRGENVVLLGEIVRLFPLFPVLVVGTEYFNCDDFRRTWMKKMRSHYAE